MRSKLGIKYFVSVLVVLAFAGMVHAAPGDILSYFSTGESQVWGLEMKEVQGPEGGGTSQIHAMVAGSQVQRFDVTTASSVKDGSLSTYDSKTRMMRTDVSAFPSLGLAIIPTYVAPYGITYSGNFSMGDGRTTQSIWGEATFYGNPGNLEWGVINGQPNAGVNGYWNEGDICGVYRTYELNQPLSCWTTWSTPSALAPTPYGIYRYQMSPWGLRDSYDKLLVMPKAVYGVTLGTGGDLYVLCQDREILHVSDSNGAILDRFYPNSAIALPFGITYDVSEGSLWISDFGTQNIYQVSCAQVVPEPTGAGRVLSSFSADVNEVWGLDIEDAAVFGNEGSFMECDVYKDFYVDVEDLGVLVDGWLDTSDMELPNSRLPGQTMLHLVGAYGEINRYDIKTASKVKDGSVSAYDSKFKMTSPTVNLYVRGVTVLHDYAGPYGRTYVATVSGGSVWRSVWGASGYGEPNNLTLNMINGGIDDGAQYEPDNWSEQKNNGGICVDRRTWISTNPDLYLWHTYSNSEPNFPYVGAGAENTIYKYVYTTWLVSSDAYELKIDMDKPLRGISIGDQNDLWVLCQDGEILNIENEPNATGGPNVIDRFFISTQVSMPWGVAYDPSEKTLWISNQANKKIYQISTEAASPEEFLPGDFNKDRFINLNDFAELASQWMSCTDPVDPLCDPSQGIPVP